MLGVIPIDDAIIGTWAATDILCTEEKGEGGIPYTRVSDIVN